MPRLIDWNKIYSHYISSEESTLKDCADKFDISHDVIRQHASANQWTKKKQQVFQAALALTERKAVEELAKRNANHIALGIALQSAAVKQMAEKNILPSTPKDIKDWIVSGITIERKARSMDQNNPTVAIQQNNFTNSSFHNIKPKGIPFEIQWGDGESLGTFAYTTNGIENIEANDSV